MSEQKINYMQQLDAWTDQAIIEPLSDDGFVAGVETSLQIRRAIREKVLESFNWRGSGVWGQSKGCPFSFCSQGLPEISAYV